MSYTITSAAWANKSHTAAVLQTVESASVLVSQDRPQLWDQFIKWTKLNNITEYHEPIQEKTPTIATILIDELSAFRSHLAAAKSFTDFKKRIAKLPPLKGI